MRQSTSITGCVRWLVGRSVGWSVTHSFDDPHVAPYWPTLPCSSTSGLIFVHQEEEICLTVDTTDPEFKPPEEDLEMVPPLDHVIRTK